MILRRSLIHACTKRACASCCSLSRLRRSRCCWRFCQLKVIPVAAIARIVPKARTQLAACSLVIGNSHEMWSHRVISPQRLLEWLGEAMATSHAEALGNAETSEIPGTEGGFANVYSGAVSWEAGRETMGGDQATQRRRLGLACLTCPPCGTANSDGASDWRLRHPGRVRCRN